MGDQEGLTLPISILYRGVNAIQYDREKGRLVPKAPGKHFSSIPRCGDPHAVCGSGIVCGEGVQNEVVYHQWAKRGLATAGLSTTPHRDRALDYALGGGRFEAGYIFHIDVTHLGNCGVSIHRVSDMVPAPSEPKDDEHILVAPDCGEIPYTTIVHIERCGHGELASCKPAR